MNLRIGEVAQRAAVTVEAVRYYERIGLLPKAPRTSSGIRRYSADVVARIRFVKQAQSNGFSLAEIRQLLEFSGRGGARRCQQVQRLLAAKLTEIDAKRALLDEFRQTLQQYAQECERSLRQTVDPECPVLGKIGRS